MSVIPQEPPSPAAARRKGIQRILLFFSEPFMDTASQGAGCITYPVEMVLDPNTPTAPPVLHVLAVPKLPPDLRPPASFRPAPR